MKHVIEGGGHAIDLGGHVLRGGGHVVAPRIDLGIIAEFISTATMTAEGTLALSAEFPLTAAALAAELGIEAALATEIWDCQEEPAGTPLVGEITGETLTPTPSTDDPTQGDASAWAGHNSVGFENNSDEAFIGTTTGLLSGSDQSKAFLAVFKVIDISVNHGLIINKRGADANTGFDLAVLSNGTLFTQVGTGAANGSAIDDDTWMVAIAGHDRTNNFARLATNRDGATISTAKTQDTTNATAIRFGKGAVFKTPHAQLAYVAAFEGAAADALVGVPATMKTAVDAFWALHTP